MAETLHAICLTASPATAAGVAAMLASLPDFTVATRTADYEDGLRDLYQALSVTTNPIPIKTAMSLAGLDVGGLRLPMIEATEEEKAVLRAALERHELLAAV